MAAWIVLLALAGDEWPRWRGGDGSGVSRESVDPAAIARPKVAFRTQLGEGLASLAVAGGRLVTMGNQGGQDLVLCLDARTGRPLWKHAYRCAAGNFHGPRATPTVADGRVYALSRTGQAWCLDAADGAVAWQVDLGRLHGARPGDYGITGSPLVLGDAVIFNAGSRGIALDRKTGAKLWAGPAGIGGFASPVAFERDGKPLVALFTAEGLDVLDPATGTAWASFPWKTPFDANAADPLVFDGGIFLSSGWERGCALLKFDGRRFSTLWQNAELRSQFASPVLHEGHLYGIDDNSPNGQLKCVEAATGRAKWSQKGGFGALLLAGTTLLSVDRAGVLVAAEASPAGYKEIARAPLLGRSAKHWTLPVLSDGLLYCRDSDGNLLALEARR